MHRFRTGVSLFDGSLMVIGARRRAQAEGDRKGSFEEDVCRSEGR